MHMIPLMFAGGGAAGGAAAAGAAVGPGTFFGLAGTAMTGGSLLSSAAGAASTGLTFAEILSGGLTALSAGSDILGGVLAKREASQQADLLEFQAEQELVQGRLQAANALEDVNKTLANKIASAGVRGSDINNGEQSDLLANVDLARLGGISSSLALRQQGSQLRRRGTASMVGGFAGGFGKFGDLASQFVSRR